MSDQNPADPPQPSAVLHHWPELAGPVRPAPDAGLINETFFVGEPTRAVLQWVNPIFDPTVHHDIAAVTERLAEQGLETPRMIPTADGGLWAEVDASDGCWRLMTYVEGRTVHRLEGPTRATAAGELVGRFHRALAGWNYRFRAPRRNIHDTPARMDELHTALAACDGHPLASEARRLGATLLDRWDLWRKEYGDPGQLPERPCHGDLKISNLRFTPEGTSPLRALCLIDLDTLGPMSLASEMGDAWRSWCNTGSEDALDSVAFDVDLFAASARGWLSEAPPLEPAERQALVPSIERICLELASRFCADAVRNTYFREDRTRYPEVGTHNLHRAQGQLALATSAREQRPVCEEIIHD